MINFHLKFNPSCPIDVFNNPLLNNNEKIIFIVIHNIIGSQEKKCTLTNEEISSASNTSLRTVINAVSKLSQLELIWIDVDRKRIVNNPNEAVRHIYTNYKYYVDRYKKEKKAIIPKEFKSIHHFRNWCKIWAIGFECTITKADDTKVPIKINDKGLLENTKLNRAYSPTTEKETIYYLWEQLYKNHETITNYIKTKNKEQ
ncbi:helix-turn-helix domain-containing protein [Halarcobacter ebronensis]|uniref:Uncharacterized protein n=1 Tax=Halarcobacter ebronensis TaxID=1462615 RepID=A0A4Q1APP0_9BACT|nr:helix-turn-helix domain-containing protein [Halarcobacter ebronensis]QKF82043.1 hypothetical protein AEBR_1560 [Halarcobacter ebronensis]RXK04123.1 hypothetical protein CRV07_11900 [Halarcobacter ebronensis]